MGSSEPAFTPGPSSLAFILKTLMECGRSAEAVTLFEKVLTEVIHYYRVLKTTAAPRVRCKSHIDDHCD